MHSKYVRKESKALVNIEICNKQFHCVLLELQFQIAVILLLLGWCTYISKCLCQRECFCHIYIKFDLINLARHNWILDKSQW